MHHAHRACRSCGQLGLAPVVSLGQTPLARGLLSADELDLPGSDLSARPGRLPELCLVQITETAAEENWCGVAASHDCAARAGRSTMPQELVADTIRRRELNCRDLVVQVASGDGYLLRHYQRADVPVLGIEGSSRDGSRGATRAGHSDPGRAVLARSGAAAGSLRPAGRRRSRSSRLGRRGRPERFCGRTCTPCSSPRAWRSSRCLMFATWSRRSNSTRSITSIFVIFRSCRWWPCLTGMVWS